ncbi:hypothetical protein C5F59_024115 [Streptomyces sp. QL37]|uniref:hypothetical protein n=1 Tax=Streptomyces sp. QL37 TaxID=2093747 RepID=UPI0011B0F14E|nr:hypothetical protein [Streptomyces sp. QL37]
MTDAGTDTTRHTRRRVVIDLVVTAVLLLPLAIMLWGSATDALQHKSATDWQANHETKRALQRNALLIIGLPVAGAVCGWTIATLRDRPTGLPAARGALAGAIALWASGIVLVLTAFHGLTGG